MLSCAVRRWRSHCILLTRFTLTGLRVCAKPSWSLVWRLLWQVTHDAPLGPSQYHDLLRMRPSPGILSLTAVERIEPQVPPPLVGPHRAEYTFDPATTADPLPVDSKAYIVRRTGSSIHLNPRRWPVDSPADSALAIRPTNDPIMKGNTASSSASSVSRTSDILASCLNAARSGIELI
jgi:hypothetical protein